MEVNRMKIYVRERKYSTVNTRKPGAVKVQSHRGAMSCFLQIWHISLKHTNEIVRAIAIIIKTMNLKQKATDRQTERKIEMFRED